MTTVVVKWQDWESILFGGFHILLEDNILCDTVLMGCDGQAQTAHSFVLAVASPVLKQQLVTRPHTNKYNLCLSGISGYVWKLILQFIYNGKIDLCNKLEADCVIKAAIELDILQLRLVAEQYLMSQQNVHLSEGPMDVTHAETLAAKEECNAAASFSTVVSDIDLANIHMQVDEQVVIENIVTSSCIKCPNSAEIGTEAVVAMEMKTTNVKEETIKLQQVTEDSSNEDVTSESAVDRTSGCESVDKTRETKPSRGHYKLLPGERPPTKYRRRNFNLVPREKPAPPPEDKYKCGVCPQYFPRKSLLAQHVSMHMDSNGRWPCKDCDKSYQRRHELIIHRRIHTGIRPYKCSFCDSRFIRSANLKDHERIHSVEKPFKCRFCSFFSKWKTTVSNHENVTHFGIRPFSCDICGNKFTKRVGLDKHKLLHTGEKPFVCSVCGHAFVQRCTWREHERRHWATKPFSCSICERQFVTRRSLLAHERLHNGERPFLCAFCGSTYTTRSNLISHQRRHTEGKTPHHCPMCPKHYAKNHSLLQHMAKVHAVSTPDNVGIDVTDVTDATTVTDVTANNPDNVGIDVTDVTGKTEDGDNDSKNNSRVDSAQSSGSTTQCFSLQAGADVAVT